MKKTKLTAIAVLLNAAHMLAGGLLTNTNQSVHFLRNPARDASTEIDAAYTNPAGLVKLEDGLHFSVTNQSVFQTRTITTTFAPFAGFGGSATKEFKGTASAPIVPSFQAAYKKGKWVLSGNAAISGGGGKATFNRGLPSFESRISMAPLAISTTPSSEFDLKTTKYSVDAYMEGSSFIYGLQLGGSYQINDMFSAYGGFRLNIVNNSYVGHLRDVKVNTADPTLNPSNGMVLASTVFAAIGKNVDLVSDKELDSSQSGWGISPIIGANFSYEGLNIGVKYEFRTPLDVENKTVVDGTGQFKDGVNTPHDIPALLTIGASYKILPELTASAGFHQFFDSSAKMANDKQKHISGGTTEYLGGLEYKINEIFLVSSGFQITRQGVKDEYQTDLSFALNSYSIGLGGAANISKNVRLNVGYFWTNYSDWTKKSADYNGTKVPGTDVFSRTNKVFGVGVDFSF